MVQRFHPGIVMEHNLKILLLRKMCSCFAYNISGDHSSSSIANLFWNLGRIFAQTTEQVNSEVFK